MLSELFSKKQRANLQSSYLTCCLVHPDQTTSVQINLGFADNVLEGSDTNTEPYVLYSGMYLNNKNGTGYVVGNSIEEPKKITVASRDWAGLALDDSEEILAVQQKMLDIIANATEITVGMDLRNYFAKPTRIVDTVEALKRLNWSDIVVPSDVLNDVIVTAKTLATETLLKLTPTQ